MVIQSGRGLERLRRYDCRLRVLKKNCNKLICRNLCDAGIIFNTRILFYEDFVGWGYMFFGLYRFVGLCGSEYHIVFGLLGSYNSRNLSDP